MEIKISHKQSSNSDIRLSRSLEINEKLKSMLKSSQLEEKVCLKYTIFNKNIVFLYILYIFQELRNQIKKLLEDKRLAIKNLEKQQLELVQAFKKQILLIDNLKRQNVLYKSLCVCNIVINFHNYFILQICLMASEQIYLTEENFMKLLNWKP